MMPAGEFVRTLASYIVSGPHPRNLKSVVKLTLKLYAFAWYETNGYGGCSVCAVIAILFCWAADTLDRAPVVVLVVITAACDDEPSILFLIGDFMRWIGMIWLRRSRRFLRLRRFSMAQAFLFYFFNSSLQTQWYVASLRDSLGGRRFFFLFLSLFFVIRIDQFYFLFLCSSVLSLCVSLYLFTTLRACVSFLNFLYGG